MFHLDLLWFTAAVLSHVAGVFVSKDKGETWKEQCNYRTTEKMVQPEHFKQNRGKGVESQILSKCHRQLIKVWQGLNEYRLDVGCSESL